MIRWTRILLTIFALLFLCWLGFRLHDTHLMYSHAVRSENYLMADIEKNYLEMYGATGGVFILQYVIAFYRLGRIK